jgi:hypothetical protein
VGASQCVSLICDHPSLRIQFVSMDSGSDKSANGDSGSGDIERILGSDGSDQVENLCALDIVVRSICSELPAVEGGVASESNPSSVENPLETPAAERARQAWKDQLTKNAEKVARKLQKMAATERAAKRKFIRDGDGRDKASKVKARKETKIGKSNPFVHFSSALLLHV